MHARILHTADLATVEAFLLRHAETSMILLANLLADGIEDGDGRFAGVYAGAFDAGGVLRAVVAHYRQTGNLFPQAETELALDAATACAVAASRRAVCGLVGRRELVRRAQTQLGLDTAPTRCNEDEGLYALDLARLREPALLSDPQVALRALRPGDAELYVEWHRASAIENVGSADDAALRASCEERFERDLAEAEPSLLTRADAPCALTGFNARLPDMVQLGGVYTPPEQRSRGYARAAVALSLLAARSRGVKRAILFTGEYNVPAITAYRALGFERIDDFALVLLE